MVKRPRFHSKMKLQREAQSPLYRQIASRLQYEIVTGAREAGERLLSLRDAAEEWGVSLHTVRRAYKDLEEAGLVTMKRPNGTRVSFLSPISRPYATALDDFISRTRREARERFGLSGGDLAARLIGDTSAGVMTRASRVAVILECSRTLSRCLADQMRSALDIDVEPRDLREPASLPPGPVLGTWFHQKELVERFHDRPDDLHLLRIRPENRLLEELRSLSASGLLWSLILLDRHPDSGHDLVVEFRSRIGPGVPVELRVPSDPVRGFPVHQPGTFVLATPQTWDDLPGHLRERADVRLLSYEVDERDLERIATLFSS